MTDEKAKSNSVTTVTYLDGKLVFGFAGIPSFTFDPDRVSAENRARAMMHGFEQRIRDGGALNRDKETGASATPEQKRAAMLRIAEHLMSGATEWQLKPQAAKADDPGLLMAGIMRAMGLDEAKAEALVVATMAKRGVDRTSALKIWQDTGAVAAAVLEIKAERAAKRPAAVDAAALMAEMMAAAGKPQEDAPM